MKSNLVKIIATFCLIIVIALILKGIFGVGKIGFNKIINSDNSKKIVFDKCWDPEGNKNYKESFARDDMEKLFFEIDLSKGTVVRTVVRKDEVIKKYSEKGTIVKKVELDNYYIKSKTQNYIETEITQHGTYVASYTFNLKNGQATINFTKPKFPSIMMQCDEY